VQAEKRRIVKTMKAFTVKDTYLGTENLMDGKGFAEAEPTDPAVHV
jgi:hypothetical protein